MISDLHLPLQRAEERGQRLGQVDVAVANMNEEACQMERDAEMFHEHLAR